MSDFSNLVTSHSTQTQYSPTNKKKLREFLVLNRVQKLIQSHDHILIKLQLNLANCLQIDENQQKLVSNY